MESTKSDRNSYTEPFSNTCNLTPHSFSELYFPHLISKLQLLTTTSIYCDILLFLQSHHQRPRKKTLATSTMKSCLPLEPAKTQSFLSSKTTYDLHHYQENDGIKITDLKCIPSKTSTLPLLQSNGQLSAGDEAMKVVREEQLLQEDICGRERLKRHRIEVAGRVWIPDIWGQEEVLKDWIDCSAFDASLVSNRIMSARAALVEEGRRRRGPACVAGRLRMKIGVEPS